MRKFIVALFAVALAAGAALGQSTGAPTLRIVTEDGNKLPAELMYGNTKVKPLRLRPGTNTPITIDDADFFVQQHYVDFLSRFPDQGGFAFWQNEITSCASNVQCIDVKRQNVSAAFFLSIEFQQTGYLVYRMYKAAYGNLPGAPVPVRRESFMPDTRSIADGVVVGTAGWPERLEANKNAFALAFVQRSDFTAAYPSNMTAEQFVTKMDQNSGDALDAAEHAALVAELGATPNDPQKRANVLRRVAEDQTLHDAEFNKAFVLMQYFGYLKRNPNDLPDTGYGGFNFWLKKLDDNNGNFIQAQMVAAFINSIE
ncbi:MAG TPA: hypothetical protein VD968_18295, partial [Pyrinomonadaceae bacterium]|nr:hypothetical protein [Pyrinomonadaceae bacterium]